MEVSLVVVQGKPEGMVIAMKVSRFLIGRDPVCNLRPNSELVSKQHCGLQISDESVIVHDLGSKNGTFVNNERIEDSKELLDGDLLRVGPLVFAVKIAVSKSQHTDPKDVSETDALSWLADSDEATVKEKLSPISTDSNAKTKSPGEETFVENRVGNQKLNTSQHSRFPIPENGSPIRNS